MLEKVKEVLWSRKIISLFLLFLIITAVPFTVLLAQKRQNVEQKAAEILNSVVNIENFSQKDISETEGVLHVALYNSDNTVYKTSAQDAAAAAEIIQENPYLQENNQAKMPLLPSAVSDNIRLERSIQDKSDTYLKKQGFSLEKEHYFYTQFIKDIPVFGSNIAIHVKNNNEIYAVDTDAITNLEIPDEIINQDRATQIALDEAIKELGNANISIFKTKKYVVNLALLGILPDARNHIALSVIIAGPKNAPKPFEKEYLVDLSNGEILQSTSLIQDAINRSIYSCTGNTCPLSRSEGSTPGSDIDVNNTYDFLGQSYNFFQNNFTRDSYDNAGATIKAAVHNPSYCPNAFWSFTYQSLYFCNGMAVNDVVGHEFGHAVTEHTSNLYYSYQSGAINESLSDIWGYAIDPDWIMGEDSALGAIRYMDDPPRKNQPDKIFSDKYYCGADDNGGVHYNSGILNKAFYLMVEGGSFNGCTMTGVGKDAAFNSVYKANLSYLTKFSNYYDLYTGLTRACNDLYGSSSNICMQIQKALRVTEMDQQSPSTNFSPKCSGITPRAPQCDVNPSDPTWTPMPTPTSLPPTPGFVLKWGTFGSGNGQFSYPYGIAVDSNGNVYVADFSNHRIQKFTSTGTFITKWGTAGSGDGQFRYPTGITIDSSGNIYVADSGNYRIQKFTSTGTFITKWGTAGSGDGQFRDRVGQPIFGIAVDSSGNVYVADSGNYRIQKFTSTGTFITKWGTKGSGDGQFTYPTGIAVDSSGNVYVADMRNDNVYLLYSRIQKFTSTGTFITKWGTAGSGDGQFRYPTGIAVDSSNNVYMTDSIGEYNITNTPIQKFTSTGTFITKWGTKGSGDGQFVYLDGITIDSSNNIYVADSGNHRIQKFAVSTPTPTPTPTSTLTPTPAPVCNACSADANKDGRVSTIDYSLMVTCFDKEATDRCISADINKNGVTDIEDFGCVINMFGQTCSQ